MRDDDLAIVRFMFMAGGIVPGHTICIQTDREGPAAPLMVEYLNDDESIANTTFMAPPQWEQRSRQGTSFPFMGEVD
jgi:hypothetical protein